MMHVWLEKYVKILSMLTSCLYSRKSQICVSAMNHLSASWSYNCCAKDYFILFIYISDE